MRKKIVAGNWKMNKTLQDGVDLAKQVEESLMEGTGEVDVIVAPPYIHLTEVARVLHRVRLSAQNCASENDGAYTGEVSAAMIRSAGASLVIIGHSERRTYYGEDDVLLNKKIRLALENELEPIFCCGEVLPERESGNHFKVVSTQIKTALAGLTEKELSRIILAYEPVWAIGTGVNATPGQAQEMHAYIRGLINEQFGGSAARDISILYGGSCKPSNAKELFNNPDVDGGLIGGASLKAEDFSGIIQSF